MGNDFKKSWPLTCAAQIGFEVPPQFMLADSWAGISSLLMVNIFTCGITSFQANYDIGWVMSPLPSRWATVREEWGPGWISAPFISDKHVNWSCHCHLMSCSPYCTSRQQKLIKKLQAEKAFQEEIQSFQETTMSFQEKIKGFQEKITDVKMVI